MFVQFAGDILILAATQYSLLFIFNRQGLLGGLWQDILAKSCLLLGESHEKPYRFDEMSVIHEWGKQFLSRLELWERIILVYSLWAIFRVHQSSLREWGLLF